MGFDDDEAECGYGTVSTGDQWMMQYTMEAGMATQANDNRE